MNFAEGIQRYVTQKHVQGIAFSHGESDLLKLARITGDVELSEIRPHHVLTFLNKSPLANITWRLKYYILTRFFDYWTAYGEMPELSMPPIRPRVRRDSLPYIYSHTELKMIIRAANDPSFRCSIHRQTLRAFLIVLYGSGARVGEVLALQVGNVDLVRRTLTINNKNAMRSRLIPIGADLIDILRRFLAWRSKMAFESQRLFALKSGRPIIPQAIGPVFRRLRKIANVIGQRKSTGHPRMMDFQCSFAVHRINSWILGKKDLNRLLPALAVYMGFSGLNTTQRYLHMAPARFKPHLNKLSPSGMKRHWRNDENLMQFLDGL